MPGNEFLFHLGVRVERRATRNKIADQILCGVLRRVLAADHDRPRGVPKTDSSNTAPRVVSGPR